MGAVVPTVVPRNRGASSLVCVSLAAAGLMFSHHGRAAEDPFAAGVRTTEPLSPDDQVATLQVPEGFRVQLVAAEPDLHKPMNLAFDATGRLWVTTSREYPFPVPVGQEGRDRVMIFGDFGPDGRARTVTEFARGLNIPIGVYPFRSPGADGRETWKAVVWSIPNLWLMEDTDGDGKADRKQALYGPFDHTRDTHGNQASFRRGFDGWLYATHGFNNDSRVSSPDGNSVHLNSGNTYRVRLDGRRIEHHTWGQVNPFGLAWDPEGNLYSSDCHSEPIYLLLRGGYYPSFGKPHDGLGFAPNMMEQIRGSTAIDAISYCSDPAWPAEYQDSVFIGDVMTSRVYRDAAVRRGSGRVARPRPDFVVSTDPWFRPVDSTFGPDGALYVADFYNRIIGHYEVPLNHPGRDRDRGRVFRIVPPGGALRPPALNDSLDGLIGELASLSLPRRMLAMQDLADRFGVGAREKLLAVLAAPARPEQAVHAAWLVQRLGGLPDGVLTRLAGAEPLVRVHAQRIATEILLSVRAGHTPSPATLAEVGTVVERGLADADPVVRRCAADAAAAGPRTAWVAPLLRLRAEADAADTHLVWMIRKALRDHLLDPVVMKAVLARADWSAPDLRALLDVALGVRTEEGARFLLQHRTAFAADREYSRSAYALIARHAPASELEALPAVLRGQKDPAFELDLFRALQQGVAQRGIPLPATAAAWGAGMAEELLAAVNQSTAWTAQPLEVAGGRPGVPWDFQDRPGPDGQPVRLLSSHPRGESLTGTLRSRPFAAPERLEFLVAGHNGPPGEQDRQLNRVRLRSASGGEVLREAFPPRQDAARKVAWDLRDLAGRSVMLEVVDADPADAWAWLAVGGLDPQVVPDPAVAPAAVATWQTAAAEVALAVGAGSLRPALIGVARDRGADLTARAAAARAVTDDPLIRAAADLVGNASLPAAWRARAAEVLFDLEKGGAEPLIAAVWKDAPQRFQVAFAGLSAARPELAVEMLQRMADGRAPASLLLDRGLRERLGRAVPADQKAHFDRLVAALPAEDPAIGTLLEQRRSGFAGAKADARRGRKVFQAACAACHQVGGEGGLVGPQLNGIGTRGVERLCEDILAPNRNVDHAFWTTVLALEDGETVSGLFRRQEGEVLVLANAAGAEMTVPRASVKERRESSVSLMPANYGEALPEEDFYHLLSYLLDPNGAR